MPETTITEALAELKTLDSRLAKKMEFVKGYLYRQDRLKDPFVNDGGSLIVIKRERQAIGDLETRKVLIRKLINEANLNNVLKIGTTERSLAEWIIWKREVAPTVQRFLTEIHNMIMVARKESAKQGVRTVGPSEAAQSDQDVVINVDEKELAKQREDFETTLGQLDGQLSLRNALVTINLPD